MRETPKFTLRQLLWGLIVSAVVLAATAGALRGGEFAVAVIAGLGYVIGVVLIFAVLALASLPFALRQQGPSGSRRLLADADASSRSQPRA